MLNSLFIFFAKDLIFVAIVIFAIYFLRQPRAVQKRIALLAVISLPLSYIVAKVAGKLYYDPRPFVGHFVPLIPHAADNGFPSDHTLLIAALSSILFPFNKRLSIAFWTLTLLVGIGRVYVGVHHSIDIIGSIVIAFVVTVIVVRFLKLKNWI